MTIVASTFHDPWERMVKEFKRSVTKADNSVAKIKISRLANRSLKNSVALRGRKRTPVPPDHLILD
jgi:hypothetical protein